MDVLVGAARHTERGQELYKLLRQAEAQAGFAGKGDIVDADADDGEDDGPPSDDD